MSAGDIEVEGKRLSLRKSDVLGIEVELFIDDHDQDASSEVSWVNPADPASSSSLSRGQAPYVVLRLGRRGWDLGGARETITAYVDVHAAEALRAQLTEALEKLGASLAGSVED